MARTEPGYEGLDTGGYFKSGGGIPGWAKGCLAAGCGCLLLIAVGSWFSGWSLFKLWKSASSQTPAVVEPFLDAVDAGDYDRARTLTSTAWQARTSPEAMRAELARIHDVLGKRTGPLEQRGVNIQTIDGQRRTILNYEVPYERGRATVHAVTVLDGGTPKLENLRFESDALRIPGTCAQCGEPYRPGDRFCAKCGAELTRSP